MWPWFETHANTLSAVAQVVTVLIALGALYYARGQIKSGRQTQREATLYHLYSEQLKLDLKYPNFSYPNIDALRQDKKINQYSDYVAHVLITMEAIIETSGEDKEWIDTINVHLTIYQRYLPDVLKYESLMYSEKLQEMMKEVISRKAHREFPQERWAAERYNS